MNQDPEKTEPTFTLTQKEELAVIEERLSSLKKHTKDTTALAYLDIAKDMVSKAKIYWK